MELCLFLKLLDFKKMLSFYGSWDKYSWNNGLDYKIGK